MGSENQQKPYFPERLQVACSQCTLGDLCLPRTLDAAGLEQFEHIVNKSRPIQPGEHIFRAGDKFQSIAAVRAGCFKSYVIDKNGEEQVLGFYLPGEIIGFDAIHEKTHRANVVALDTSSVCGLSFESVSEMARQLPQLQEELFRVMSLHISELEASAADLSAEVKANLAPLSSMLHWKPRPSDQRKTTTAKKTIRTAAPTKVKSYKKRSKKPNKS
mgnify:CR=1 FL=1